MYTAFLVELFPFHVRARGIAIFQWWSRGGAFLSQFVNPIGIDAVGVSIRLVHLMFVGLMKPAGRQAGDGTLCKLSFWDVDQMDRC